MTVGTMTVGTMDGKTSSAVEQPSVTISSDRYVAYLGLLSITKIYVLLLSV